MTDDTHESWAGHAASYALGALDDRERTGFEAHLATCEACRAEVASYGDVTIGLAGAIPQAEPPAALRSRILDEARRVRPLSAAAPMKAADTPAPSRATSPPPKRFGPATWLAAASIGIALIAAAAWYSERNARDQLEGALIDVRAEASTNAERVATLEAGIAQRDSVLSAVLAPDIETTRLTSEGRPPSARVYWSRQAGRVVLAAYDLPAAPAGRTYQLWGIAGGNAPVSLGTFNTGAAGSATVTLPVDPSLRIDVAAVTEEPAGGSPQPTTQPFLVGGIASQ
jgi:anti-sigma-K factor RskA